MINVLKKTSQTMFVYFVLGFLITINFQNPATAAWSSNLRENTPVCTASGQQSSLQIISDGAGGVIIAWEDTRNVHFDIYAQRIDAHGNVLWMKDGISICSAPENQNRPRIVSDGAGGAIITWHDVRNGISNSDIYAQHIDADGNVQWTKDGIPVCAVANAQNSPCIATDGAGGAIIIWQDFRRTYADIYAQRVDGSGKTAWERSGVALCNAPGHETFPVITGNGAEGAIVAWVDTRNGNNDVFAQQVDGNGTVQWLTNGIPVCTVSGNQNYPVIVSDGAGGAILAWWDMRSGDFNIYAQRIDLTGNALWVKDGLAVCVEANIQNCVSISSDGAGGAIISWNDNRDSAFDVYAQRIDPKGLAKWNNNGVAVCTAFDTQCFPVTINDGTGGAIIVWQDSRDSDKSYWDVYTQKINGQGSLGD